MFLTRTARHDTAPPSRDAARDRLRFVLVSDRAGISPRMLASLKDDLLRAIATYVDVDPRGPEFSVATTDGVSALVASIPIRRLRQHWEPPADAGE